MASVSPNRFAAFVTAKTDVDIKNAKCFVLGHCATFEDAVALVAYERGDNEPGSMWQGYADKWWYHVKDRETGQINTLVNDAWHVTNSKPTLSLVDDHKARDRLTMLATGLVFMTACLLAQA